MFYSLSVILFLAVEVGVIIFFVASGFQDAMLDSANEGVNASFSFTHVPLLLFNALIFSFLLMLLIAKPTLSIVAIVLFLLITFLLRNYFRDQHTTIKQTSQKKDSPTIKIRKIFHLLFLLVAMIMIITKGYDILFAFIGGSALLLLSIYIFIAGTILIIGGIKSLHIALSISFWISVFFILLLGLIYFISPTSMSSSVSISYLVRLNNVPSGNIPVFLLIGLVMLASMVERYIFSVGMYKKKVALSKIRPGLPFLLLPVVFPLLVAFYPIDIAKTSIGMNTMVSNVYVGNALELFVISSVLVTLLIQILHAFYDSFENMSNGTLINDNRKRILNYRLTMAFGMALLIFSAMIYKVFMTDWNSDILYILFLLTLPGIFTHFMNIFFRYEDIIYYLLLGIGLIAGMLSYVNNLGFINIGTSIVGSDNRLVHFVYDSLFVCFSMILVFVISIVIEKKSKKKNNVLSHK